MQDPWWYHQVKTEFFSDSAFLCHFNEERDLQASLTFNDTEGGAHFQSDKEIDLLILFTALTRVDFTVQVSEIWIEDLRPCIHRGQKTVTSSHRSLDIDYPNGLLIINADKVPETSEKLELTQ